MKRIAKKIVIRSPKKCVGSHKERNSEVKNMEVRKSTKKKQKINHLDQEEKKKE